MMIEYERSIHQRFSLCKQGWVLVRHFELTDNFLTKFGTKTFSERKIAKRFRYFTIDGSWYREKIQGVGGNLGA